MRLTLLAILCLHLLHADSSQKIWTSRNSEILQRQTTSTNEEAINRLQEIIGQQLAAKEKKDQSLNVQSPAGAVSSQFLSPDHRAAQIPEPLSWRTVLSRQYILWGLLAISVFLLIILLTFRGRRSMQQNKEGGFDNPVMEETLASKNLLQQFIALRGEVHMRFLERKQNILFHEEFTQYQKAKALLELEKRYTRLEYIELPKLFSEELETFTEGQRALTSQPELQEITSRFIRIVMQKSDFTKAQKSEILKNLKNHYRTPSHTWDYDENMKEEVEASQLDYLLQ